MKASGVGGEAGSEALHFLRRPRKFASPDKLHDAKRGACHAAALGTPKRNKGGLAEADFFTEPKNVCIAK